MAVKFKARFPRIKIVNRCLLCGRVISDYKNICDTCSRRKNTKRTSTN